MSLSTRTLHRLATALGRGSAAEIDDALSAGSDGAVLPDGSVPMTAPLDFAGAEGDATGGATVGWDNGQYGVVIKGREGAGDTELYIINPDDPSQFLNVYFNSGSVHLALHGAAGHSEIATTDAGAGLIIDGDVELNGGGLILAADDGSRHRIVVANDGTLSTVAYP